MIETINGAVFGTMICNASAALEENKQLINELNVFPVPDGDTGTNMGLTMETAAAEISRKATENISKAADMTASALLRGARGNSGVILSLLFRGISKRLKGKEAANAAAFSAAMMDGVDSAYKAVMKPAEGTILTVSRLAASAAKAYAETGTDIELMLTYALESAREALANTVNLNPVLKRAGVVDAGGKGYVLILEAMLAAVQGHVYENSGTQSVSDKADFSIFDTSEITFAYDTVFIVRRDGNTRSLDLLRAYLDSIGDSLVIGEDDESFKVHVHTNIPGEALTEAQKYGTLELAKIENMRTQHDELAEKNEEAAPVVAAPEKKFGSVAVCAGEGMAEIFRAVGVDRIVTGGQTMNPSTEDILREINATPAETVFVFPNNKNIVMAAEQCVPLTEKAVVVIPTRTVPQGVSAMLAFDAEAETEPCAEAMREAASLVHTALITYAARDSDFDGHDIKAGEYLALLDGALIGSYSDFDALMAAVAESVSAFEPEMLTVYYGADVEEADAGKAGAALEKALPDAEVTVLSGGQPVYYYMIAAE